MQKKTHRASPCARNCPRFTEFKKDIKHDLDSKTPPCLVESFSGGLGVVAHVHNKATLKAEMWITGSRPTWVIM